MLDVAIYKPKELQKVTTPQWVLDLKRRERIQRSYVAYIRGTPVPDIARAEKLSIATIYDYINKGKELAIKELERNLVEATAEQLEKRRQITVEALRSLAVVRADTSISAFGRAKSESDLLRTILENETAVEEIRGLRGKRATVINQSGIGPGTTINIHLGDAEKHPVGSVLEVEPRVIDPGYTEPDQSYTETFTEEPSDESAK